MMCGPGLSHVMAEGEPVMPHALAQHRAAPADVQWVHPGVFFLGGGLRPDGASCSLFFSRPRP